MTREEHHAHLRELGMGWLVDEVESRPRPHVASARKTPYGVRLAVDLYRAGWHHGAVAEISDAKIGSLVDARTTIGGLLDDLACTSDGMAAELTERHALRGKRGVL